MRKAFALILALLLLSIGSVTASAQEQYATAEDLYEDWCDALPDYICGVWYTGGQIESLTFGIQNNEAGNAGIQLMRSLVESDWSIRFVYQQFSRNYLLQIQKEIDDAYFEKDLGLVSTGLDDRNNCIVIEFQQSQKDHAATQKAVAEITEKYGKAVNISYTSAQIEFTVGDNNSPYTHLMPFQHPSFLPIVLLPVFLVAVVLLIILRRKVFLLRTNRGVVGSQIVPLSSKEVKEMIKKSGYVILPDFDAQVMDRINAYAKENGVTTPGKKMRIPMWSRWAAAAACLCVVAVLGFVGIKDVLTSKPSKEGTQYDTPFYSITAEDGQYKMLPKVTLSHPKIPSNLGVSMGYLYPSFKSIEEMRKAITTGSFAECELYGLFHSSQKTDSGIAICDPEHLYAFTFPDEFVIRRVTWYGKSYDCSLTSKTARNNNMKCYDQEAYAEDINLDFKHFLSDSHVTITEQRKTPDRFATEYYGDTDDTKLKYICYEISRGNKKMYIQEKYILESSYSNNVSSDVPSYIEFWGTENSGYFSGYVNGLTERPSVEWLLQFGLTPYAAD